MSGARNTAERRTIATFPSHFATREPGFYTHMFIEDITVGLMGFRYTEEAPKRGVALEGDEGGLAVLKGICTSIADYPRHGIDETVESAIESIGRRLAWYGKAVFEICVSGPEISLAPVVPFHLFRIPGGFVQVAPRVDYQRGDGPRYAFLPSKNAWVVRIPRNLGGATAYRRLLDELTAVSKPAPEFWMRELEAGKLSTQFNASSYNRRRDAFVARLTRKWGWNRRDSSGINTTQIFYFYRSLRFRQAQALLRDHIVDELNSLARRLQIIAKIRLKGFLSAAEIADLIKQALAGSLNYAKAWEKAR